MKRLHLLALGLVVLFAACKSGSDASGHFTVEGELKNAPDQQVYLDRLSFKNENPQVIDTAEIKDGKFNLTGHASEEGMFRIRLEKADAGYIFINDIEKIPFKADVNDLSLAGPTFSSPANQSLKLFLLHLEEERTRMMEGTSKIERLKSIGDSANAIPDIEKGLIKQEDEYKNYMVSFIDTVSNPVVALFAIGYTQGIEPEKLAPSIKGLPKRFPNHEGIATITKQFNDFMAGKTNEQSEPEAPNSRGVKLGAIAPEITLPDTEGKSFSLHELRGKYVLIDFWASWCAPCRSENPHVVEAYEKYKNKNFTILGVSLDKDKTDWLKAIKDDKLSWKQISDLQFWNSPVVPLYGFDGIPYNVLIDPSGKVLATELRGKALENKLAEVLK
ncbi:MAG: AhpC/TSA family protein [Ferruginibacter sp.]|nr:AhpC/TSA family protein [Ferruginibacter sp.]